MPIREITLSDGTVCRRMVTNVQPRLNNLSNSRISKAELLEWAENTLKPAAALAAKLDDGKDLIKIFSLPDKYGQQTDPRTLPAQWVRFKCYKFELQYSVTIIWSRARMSGMLRPRK